MKHKAIYCVCMYTETVHDELLLYFNFLSQKVYKFLIKTAKLIIYSSNNLIFLQNNIQDELLTLDCFYITKSAFEY